MVCPILRGRRFFMSNSRKQSSAKSRAREMEDRALVLCGVTAIWRVSRISPCKTSSASLRTAWRAALFPEVAGESVSPRESGAELSLGVGPREEDDVHRGLAGHLLLRVLFRVGARCKAQRLRCSINEIAQWPALQCHHMHEAEYTAPSRSGLRSQFRAWLGFARLRVHVSLSPVGH